MPKVGRDSRGGARPVEVVLVKKKKEASCQKKRVRGGRDALGRRDGGAGARAVEVVVKVEKVAARATKKESGRGAMPRSLETAAPVRARVEVVVVVESRCSQRKWLVVKKGLSQPKRES